VIFEQKRQFYGVLIAPLRVILAMLSQLGKILLSCVLMSVKVIACIFNQEGVVIGFVGRRFLSTQQADIQRAIKLSKEVFVDD
jgi:hypothetical protein